MARQRARVVLHGRFSPGTVVRLVAVRDERVLRPGAGDREVDHKIVDAGGRVEFSSGIVAGARYFVCGIQQGVPLEVRATGRTGEGDPVNGIGPVSVEPRKFANGGGDVDAPAHEVVAAAEEAERLRKAGPAGSDSEAAERHAIRREKRAVVAQEQAAGDGSDPRDDNQSENEGAV